MGNDKLRTDNQTVHTDAVRVESYNTQNKKQVYTTYRAPSKAATIEREFIDLGTLTLGQTKAVTFAVGSGSTKRLPVYVEVISTASFNVGDKMILLRGSDRICDLAARSSWADLDESYPNNDFNTDTFSVTVPRAGDYGILIIYYKE
jgi:hypothetical protein